MTKTAFSIARRCIVAALLVALRLSADVIVTSNGSRIVGKITKIHGGVITLDTDYAGQISIKQVLVTSITTDAPVAVRFADGSGVTGVVSSPTPDRVRVSSAKKTVEGPVGNIAATWAAGQEDPDAVALRRKWSYEAGVDINGHSGTHHQLGTSYGFRAKLVGPLDVFQYYTNYSRQESDGLVSADQFKAGVDYADNFTALKSWYIRDEAGFDRVNQITFYDIAATGFGYDFVKKKDETFIGRAGVSYRYDHYSPGKAGDLSQLGADLGLEYTVKIKQSKLLDRISFDPAFADLGNYVVSHEFAFEVPITKSLWKLGTGVTNNFNSRPVAGVKKLETVFFTRLVLTWGEGLAQQH